VLAPGKDKIELHYTALSLRVPARVRFQYKLEGYDREWVRAGTRRVAYYNNLPAGNYRFLVLACNDDGVCNNAGASLEFAVLPHLYQTWWFYMSCVVLAGLTALELHRIRTRHLRAR